MLVAWRFDRLGRTLKHLIELMAELEQQGIDFHSIQEAIDITTRAASWPSIQAFGLSLDFPLGLALHKGSYATPVGEFKFVQKETTASSLEKVPSGLAVVPGETRNMVMTAGDWLAGSDQAVMPFDQGAFCVHNGPEERLTVLRSDHHDFGEPRHQDSNLVFAGCIK